MRLIIIGASGHGKVIADIAHLTGYQDIVFLDDDTEKKECGEYPVLGPTKMAKDMEGFLAVGIGDPAIRKNNDGKRT